MYILLYKLILYLFMYILYVLGKTFLSRETWNNTFLQKHVSMMLLEVSLSCLHFSLMFSEGEVKSPCFLQVRWVLSGIQKFAILAENAPLIKKIKYWYNSSYIPVCIHFVHETLVNYTKYIFCIMYKIANFCYP
jgi:hypothetical protein